MAVVVVVGLLRMKLVLMMVEDLLGTKLVAMTMEDMRGTKLMGIIWRKCLGSLDQRRYSRARKD
jgi:hypothetical protein